MIAITEKWRILPFLGQLCDRDHAKMLETRELPENQWSNRTKLLKEAAEKAGYGDRFELVPLAVRFQDGFDWDASTEPNPNDTTWGVNSHGLPQGTCAHLGQCELGCPVEARNTLALNYIPTAERNGAVVWPLHIVRHINPRADGGYQIRFDRVIGRRLQGGTVSAAIVVVSAGSIGSTELLLRCRDQYKTLTEMSPMVGKRWASNANYLSFALHPKQEPYPTRGVTISGAIKFLGDNAYKGQKFTIEDGGLHDWFDDVRPRLSGPLGPGAMFAPDLQKLQSGIQGQPLKDLMPWFAQGRDRPIGELKLAEQAIGP